MANKTPQTMSPEEIVQEIAKIRDDIEASTQRIHELSKVLYAHSRRNSSRGEATYAYITYSNAWMRFSGAISQGLTRTKVNDRALERAHKSDHEQAVKRAAADKAKKEAKEKKAEEEAKAAEVAKKKAEEEAKATSPVFGDLIELYGEEMVRDASR